MATCQIYSEQLAYLQLPLTLRVVPLDHEQFRLRNATALVFRNNGSSLRPFRLVS